MAVVRLVDLKTVAREDIRVELTHVRVVLHDQNERIPERRVDARGHLRAS